MLSNVGPLGAGGGSNCDAEVKGNVVQVDANANTFKVRVFEAEYLYRCGGRAENPLTVRYGAVEFIENWLRPGYHIEADGSYNSDSNVLTAYEVELEHRGDGRDDDRYHDRHDDRDDHDDHDDHDDDDYDDDDY